MKLNPQTTMNRQTFTVVSVVIILLLVAVLVSVLNKKDEIIPISTPSNSVVTPPNISTETPTTSPTYSEKILPYGDFALQPGETAKFKHISVTLLAVTEDSRCAEGVTCVWAGTLKAKLQFSSESGTSSKIIELGKQLTGESEIIKLLTATPYPKSGKNIQENEYRLTFHIQKKVSGVKPVPPPQQATSTKPLGCFVGGCSNQICSDSQGMVSTCIYKEEYACYKNATCARQSDGACGWTKTKDLEMCLSSANQQAN